MGLLTSWGDSEYQLYHALRLGGPPPKEWLTFWDLEVYRQKDSRLPSFNKEEAWKAWEKDDGSTEAVLDLVRRMVVTEPSERSSLCSLLSHPFFSDHSLPPDRTQKV